MQLSISFKYKAHRSLLYKQQHSTKPVTQYHVKFQPPQFESTVSLNSSSPSSQILLEASTLLILPHSSSSSKLFFPCSSAVRNSPFKGCISLPPQKFKPPADWLKALFSVWPSTESPTTFHWMTASSKRRGIRVQFLDWVGLQ